MNRIPHPLPICRKPDACSHDWRDVRYVHQTVFNVSVAPVVVDPAPREFRRMQKGHRYVCINCGLRLDITEDGQSISPGYVTEI